MKYLSWLAFAGMALAALTGAEGNGPGEADEPYAKPRLISEHTALVPGTTAYLGITFDIAPGWHVYWDGAGDTGMPVQVDAQLPDGYRAGDLLWPTPKRYTSPGDLLDYVFEERVTILLPVHVPATAKPGENVRIAATLDWLECSDICLAGEADVELTLPVAAPAAPPKKSPDAARFEETRRHLPRPLPTENPGVEFSWSGSRLAARAPGASSIAFYPLSSSLRMARPIAEGKADGDTLSVEFESSRSGRTRVQGVLEITRAAENGGVVVYAIDLPGPPAG